jgi:hypothetical protein
MKPSGGHAAGRYPGHLVVRTRRTMQTLSYTLVELGERSGPNTPAWYQAKIVDLACPQRINHAV